MGEPWAARRSHSQDEGPQEGEHEEDSDSEGRHHSHGHGRHMSDPQIGHLDRPYTAPCKSTPPPRPIMHAVTCVAVVTPVSNTRLNDAINPL